MLSSFSLLGKVALFGSLAAMLAAGAAVMKHEYDAGIIAKVAAQQSAAVLAAEQADSAKIIAALQDRAAQAEAQAASIAATKEAIDHATPSTFSCIRSPAGRVALGSLRPASGGHSGSASRASSRP